MPKKKITFYIVLISALIIFIFLSYIVIQNLMQQNSIKKSIDSLAHFDASTPFTINKIVYFSCANCSSDINANSSFTINNLYQSTDIAIFINNNVMAHTMRLSLPTI